MIRLEARAFQSTPPVWGATCGIEFSGRNKRISIHAPRVGGDLEMTQRVRANLKFQSTPPVWGATRLGAVRLSRLGISIHAPRVGGDTGTCSFRSSTRYFNPRPPCGGRPSAGGCTTFSARNFNPRPPCGGRPTQCDFIGGSSNISIHAPRVGGDQTNEVTDELLALFQSTPPVWGATWSYRIKEE